MTNRRPHEPAPDDRLPQELLDIAQKLERLADVDRAAASTGLEDRVHRRSLAGFEPGAPHNLAFPLARRPWSVAAALALAGGAVIATIWFTILPSPGTETEEIAQLESEIDEFLTIAASWEEFVPELSLDSLTEEEELWESEELERLLREDSL